MFSDDELLDRLVLKGGNALDLIHNVSLRGSIDLDFSVPDDFNNIERNQLKNKLTRSLEKTFDAEGYKVFDIEFKAVPAKISEELKDFWGGYRLEFKVIENYRFPNLVRNRELLQKSALVIGEANRKIFRIDISKYEYCDAKERHEIDGYTIYVYGPAMIVAEKLRAICQQSDEYRKFVKSSFKTARARDFFDIYSVIERYNIDIADQYMIDLIKNIFEAKKVPLKLLTQIGESRDFHKDDFLSLKATIRDTSGLREFEYYFNYVVKMVDQLKAKGVV